MSIILRVLLVLIGYWLWRSAFRALRAQGEPRPSGAAGESSDGARWLVHDPVCDTYIPQGRAIARKISGEVVYFCSEDCSRKHTACTA